VLHVLTVHFESDVWIEPQLRYLQRFAPPDTRIWASLNGIDRALWSRFHFADELPGTHPQKLNLLAQKVIEVADPGDHLLFLDGDAFPVANLEPLLADALPLIAVRRRENFGDPQPHPCFAITTAAFWKAIDGDWRAGYKWTNSLGVQVTDPGANLYRRLLDDGIEWRPLDRLNTVNPHPLWFAVYGDERSGPVVYHHGAGFRDPVGRTDTMKAGFAFEMSRARTPERFRVVHRLERHLRGRLAARRRARWVRDELPRQRALADEVFSAIVAGDDVVTRFVPH
jgi:hypothetical protein